MEQKNNIIKSLGVSQKLTPIISFNTIVDIDFGLTNLIYDQYLNTDVFCEEFFKRNIIDIVRDLYLRQYKNPLYLFAKDNADHKLLDEYYQEFIETKREDIYKYSITTDILHLIESFNNNPSEIVKCAILYFYPEELEILNQEEALKTNQKIFIDDLKDKDKNFYNQLFFKDWSEIEKFGIFKEKTYYISSCGINMNNNKSDFEYESIIKNIIGNRSRINLFDIYSTDILERNTDNGNK